MRKVLIAFLFCFSAFAKVNLELQMDSSSVKQGEIVDARLKLLPSDGQVQLNGLKGQNFGKTLYILSLSPFVREDGRGHFESEAKIIFSSVPQGDRVVDKIKNEEIEISWKDIQVIPTEAEKSFLLGDFEVPSRKKFLPWILGLLGLGILVIAGLWITRIIKSKKAQKRRREELKYSLLTAKSYEDVVLVWNDKRNFLHAFPQIEPQFKKLEETLFRYTFKQHRNEAEMQNVMDAYEQFKGEVKGQLDGI